MSEQLISTQFNGPIVISIRDVQRLQAQLDEYYQLYNALTEDELLARKAYDDAHAQVTSMLHFNKTGLTIDEINQREEELKILIENRNTLRDAKDVAQRKASEELRRIQEMDEVRLIEIQIQRALQNTEM